MMSIKVMVMKMEPKDMKGFPLPYGDGNGTRFSNLEEWTKKMLDEMSGDGEIVIKRRNYPPRRITWERAKEIVHYAGLRHDEEIEEWDREKIGDPPEYTL